MPAPGSSWMANHLHFPNFMDQNGSCGCKHTGRSQTCLLSHLVKATVPSCFILPFFICFITGWGRFPSSRILLSSFWGQDAHPEGTEPSRVDSASGVGRDSEARAHWSHLGKDGLHSQLLSTHICAGHASKLLD